MEVKKCWRVLGLYVYVSTVKLRPRRTVEEALRHRHDTLVRRKKALYKAQSGRCALCGLSLPREGLEIHHKIGVSVAPQLALDKNNMVLLCHACHAGVHRGELRIDN